MSARFVSLVLAAGVALGVTASAKAATVSREFILGASDFVYNCCSVTPPAVDPVSLDIKLHFDDSADIGATTAGMTVVSFNLPYSAQYAYATASDVLEIATSIPTIGTCGSPASSFCAFIHNATSAAPTLAFFSQVTPGLGQWISSTHSLSYVDTVTAIDRSGAPEPAAWALMLLGFGGLGATMRLRRSGMRRALV